jgi:hypothetical protein
MVVLGFETLLRGVSDWLMFYMKEVLSRFRRDCHHHVATTGSKFGRTICLAHHFSDSEDLSDGLGDSYYSESFGVVLCLPFSPYRV